MLNKTIAVLLVVVLCHGSAVAQDQSRSSPQTIAKMQQVLHKAQEKSKAVKVTLNRKMDNRNKLTGKVSEISDTGFTVSDQKTGRAMPLVYADVREVKQKGMPKAAKIAIGVGAGIVLWVVIVIAVAGGLPD